MTWGTLRILWVLGAHVGTFALVHDRDLSRSWRPWSLLLLLLLLLLCLHLKELPLPLLLEPVLSLVEVLLDLLEGLLLLQLVSLGHNCRPVLVQLLLQHVLRLLPGHLLRVLLLHPLLLLPQLGQHLGGEAAKGSLGETELNH